MKNKDKKLSALKAKAKEWQKLYPQGEPIYGITFIEPKQVAAILTIHLRTAQIELQIIREVLGKKKKSNVSVKEFCFIYNYDEEDFLKALQ